MGILRQLGIAVLGASAFQGCDGLGFGAAGTPAVTLVASPADVAVGGPTTLAWRTVRASACSGSGGWAGAKPLAGEQTIRSIAGPTRFILNCTGPGGSTSAAAAINTGTASSRMAFPLHVEPAKRYLVDAVGNPFLIYGDAAWSLIVQLTREQVDIYLDDRHARGFNTLLVNLLEHRYADHPPKNVYGDGPFVTPGDFSAPNEAYFAHADWVVRRAAQKGFLVLLAPAYLGYNGKDHGWYQEMSANGAAKLLQYGRYLGQRYRDFTNIIWVNAGDYNPPDRSLVEAVAAGIHEAQPNVLESAHCGPDTAAVDYWGSEPWLQVNTVYTHEPVYAAALSQYRQSRQMPFFLIEGAYENEHDISTTRVRTEAYHALLSGAAGQVFGNNPTWNFNGRPLFPTSLTWQGQLGSPGARSMTHLRTLFGALKWWTLVPDAANTILTFGAGKAHDRAVAAVANDRSFALVYLPSARPIAIELGALAGPHVKASWFDPSDGSYSQIFGSPFPAGGHHMFQPRRVNAGEAQDWVLVLEATP